MKNKLWYLIKTSLKKKFSSKWFITINILLLILIPCIVNIDNIIKYFGGDFNEPTKVYVYSNEYVYDSFIENISRSVYLNSDIKLKITEPKETIDKLKESIKKEEKKDIIININEEDGVIGAEIISYEYVSAITYQAIVSAINNVKVNYSLINSGIDLEKLNYAYEEIKIDRVYLTDELDENGELMNTIGGILIPVLIIPMFMLVVMSVNMIGAEINEEKTSKSMEIIISSVSPMVHFSSKIISSNIFIITQGLLLLIFGGIGLISRGLVTGSNLISSFNIESTEIVSTFVTSGIFDNIIKALPFLLIMLLLTFLAYSLAAGILASMTTSMEDYQQLQTPIMLIMMFAYYIAIIASTYESSIFIKTVSFLPFISGILAPVLLILGQISYIDIVISMLLLALINFLLLKYGVKIYKSGILNYSSKGLWKKMFDAVKEK